METRKAEAVSSPKRGSGNTQGTGGVFAAKAQRNTQGNGGVCYLS